MRVSVFLTAEVCLMTRKLYFGQPWDEPGYPESWISFEDNPEFLLTGAKSKFCQACLYALKKGLLSYESGRGLDIGPGAYCWKAVLGMETAKSPEEARRFLEKHQDDFLPDAVGIHGKIGGGEKLGQQQIMIHCDNIVQVEVYKESMRGWLGTHHNHPLNSHSTERGCKHPFLELFGPVSSKNRSQRMEPTGPEAIPTVLDVYLQDSTIASFDPMNLQRRKTRL